RVVLTEVRLHEAFRVTFALRPGVAARKAPAVAFLTLALEGDFDRLVGALRFRIAQIVRRERNHAAVLTVQRHRDAAARVEDDVLVVAGPGAGATSKTFVEAVLQHRLVDRAVFSGRDEFAVGVVDAEGPAVVEAVAVADDVFVFLRRFVIGGDFVRRTDDCRPNSGKPLKPPDDLRKNTK